MTNKKYGEKEIELAQKELCALGVFEEFTDYRISEPYLREFLKQLERNHETRDYIVSSQLIPLLCRLKKKYPNLTDREMVEKAHDMIPLIRAMFYHQKILSIVRKAKKSCCQISHR